MKQFTESELKAINRIYNHTDNLTNGFFGSQKRHPGLKTQAETTEYASRNRWIMFAAPGIDSLREGAGAPFPNIYISCDEEFQDNGNGQTDGWVGFSFGNQSSMFGLRYMLKRKNRAASFVSFLNNLGPAWTFEVYQKYHVGTFKSTPRYLEIQGVDAGKVTLDDILDGIEVSDNSLIQRGQIVDDEEVIDCVTTIGVGSELTVSNFDQRIKEIFSIFPPILNLL